MKKSKKAIFDILTTYLFYLWEASKIVFKKSSQFSSFLSTSKMAKTSGLVNPLHQTLQGSKLHLKLGSTWKTMWTKMSLKRNGKQNWKLPMKLRQIYQNMSHPLTFYSKFSKHLNKISSWKQCMKGIFSKNIKHFLSKRSKSNVRQGGKRIDHKFLFLRSCLQNLKKFNRRHRGLTWGEIVHSHNDRHQAIIKKYNTRLQLYRKMPLRQMSRLWGRFNKLQLPLWLRSPTLRLYIWLFNCCLEEAAVQDLKQYPNVGKFFQRHLLPGVRPIDDHPLISPCDGTVLHCGIVINDTLEQVKGVGYSLKGFLGPAKHHSSSKGQTDSDRWTEVEMDDCLSHSRQLLVNAANHLHHCIIYLAPGDYHRFHSPADWFVRSRRHFPGELFSVNPSIARWLQGLFSFNERVVYSGQWKYGYMSVTPVGATNVGSISIYHDKELLTNMARTWPNGCFYDKDFTDENKSNGVEMEKGQAFGHFSLGSTIVLLFEAPLSFRFTIKPGQKLKYGQGIGLCSKKLTKQTKKKVKSAKLF